MVDNLTTEQRSKCMSRIRSKWTKQEVMVHNYLKGLKIKHKMHPNIAGKPDVFLNKSNTAVFLHGCFWHKCSKCYKEPKTRKEYWLPKIEKNVIRDRRNTKILKLNGFSVLKIWEHDVKINFIKTVDKMIKNDRRNNKKRSN